MNWKDWLKSGTIRALLIMTGFSCLSYAFLATDKVETKDYLLFISMMFTYFFLTDKPKTP